MGKIIKLPENLISKIAAGEVIERPSFALKELLENSIDSGADFIKIELEKSGLKKITVSDNGEGMSEVDIKLSFKPHTTSKILKEEDLIGIKTLGFRGEALSSLASISDMLITSKNKSQTGGLKVKLKAGKVDYIYPIGVDVGTTIMVENLFYPVPVRQKFLKSLQTEYRHLLEVVISFSLSFPNIRFSLTHNKKLIFDLPKNQPILQRIKTLLGQTITDSLIDVNFEESYFKVSGFLGKPQISTTNYNKNFLFINKRKVSDKLISSAIKEAYGNLLDNLSYPIFILNISLPYEAVDVNIHPRKETVSFVDNRFIFDSVKKAVDETLSKNNLTFFNLNWKDDNFKSTKSYAGKLLKEEVLSDNIGQVLKNSEILQIHDTYLVTESKQGIILIDQHAASEKILYQKLKQTFKKHQANIQVINLPKALPLDLSFSEAQILNDNITLFTQLGFEIEPFLGNTFKINTTSLLFQDRDPQQIIKEVLEDLEDGKNPKEVDSESEKMLQFLACRAAIKAGDKLTQKECKDLIEKLEDTDDNYTCPHGRPTQIEMPLSQIHRFFKRI